MSAIGAVKDLIKICPVCQSGDVRFCLISVRPYCAECGYWPPPHWGTAHEIVAKWNNDPRRANA